MNTNIEAAQLVEQTYEDHERRYEICSSFSQIKYMVILHLNTPMKLSNYSYHVFYNTPIQIESDINITLPRNQPIPSLLLSTLITDYQIDIQNIFKLNSQSFITVTYENNQYLRNTFSFQSVAPRVPGSPVLYGEDFYIHLSNTNKPPLYLTAVVQSVDNFRHIKDRMRVYLTSTPDRFSRFRFVDPSPEKFHKLQYTPVLTFKRLFIVHTVTDFLLTAELNKSILSTYSVDHPVTCCTYRNQQNQISSEHFWKIMTQPYIEESKQENGNAYNSHLQYLY